MVAKIKPLNMYMHDIIKKLKCALFIDKDIGNDIGAITLFFLSKQAWLSIKMAQSLLIYWLDQYTVTHYPQLHCYIYSSLLLPSPLCEPYFSPCQPRGLNLWFLHRMKKSVTSALAAMLALTVCPISWSVNRWLRVSASTSSVWVSNY